MELQHVNVKLLVKNPEEVDLEPLIPIFHSWIQDQVSEELLLDVADYRHVHAGPGMVLIGHQANYSVDNTDNRLGVRYNRKAPLEGSNQDRLKQATRAALIACQRLEADPRLNGKLRFNGQEMEIFINDRLLAPNRGRTREIVEPEFRAFFRALFGGAEYSLSFGNGDPRRLFSVSVRTPRPFHAADLLNNLVR
ncbi:MAG: hypothetical protein HYS33_09820 [Acidobacteria bacterium]|nr:hypothetical protein [Acidobacteriota bacterium]